MIKLKFDKTSNIYIIFKYLNFFINLYLNNSTIFTIINKLNPKLL